MANLTITVASVARGTGSQVSSGTADVAITQGQSVYLDTTTLTVKLADADLLASASTNVGVSLNAAAAGQPVTYQTTGPITIGATVATGAAYYVSATAGSICLESDLTTGDFPLLLGFATSTTVINLLPFAARVAKA